jgi:hypothetical protein
MPFSPRWIRRFTVIVFPTCSTLPLSALRRETAVAQVVKIQPGVATVRRTRMQTVWRIAGMNRAGQLSDGQLLQPCAEILRASRKFDIDLAGETGNVTAASRSKVPDDAQLLTITRYQVVTLEPDAPREGHTVPEYVSCRWIARRFRTRRRTRRRATSSLFGARKPPGWATPALLITSVTSDASSAAAVTSSDLVTSSRNTAMAAPGNLCAHHERLNA